MFSRRGTKRLRVDAKRLQLETLEDRIVMSADALLAPPPIEPAAVQTSAALLSTEDWVHSLQYYQFNQLLPEHVQYLTPAQVASIPNTSYFAAMSAGARGAMNAAQVQALNVANIRINLLTPTQVGYLTTAQVQSLPFWDFEFLAPAQVPLLTSGQIASINGTAVFDTWTAPAKAALTVPQIQSLNMSLVRPTVLSAAQLGSLTATQIQSIAYYDLNLLTAAQIPYVSAAQMASIPTSGFIAALTPAARAALTAPQIQAINPAALSLPLLTPTQIAALTTVQVQSIPFWDLHLLGASQIPLLTAAQVASINSASVLAAWSSASRAALTMAQVQSLNMNLVRPTPLSATQIGWLTPAQVQLIANYDFNLLPASQIPHLTAAQIASMPTVGFMSAWTPAARAALTMTQVRAISVSALSLPLLTPQQIGYLTAAQIQAVPFWEMYLLTPVQIPFLTSTQMASINSANIITAWSAEARAALTTPQVQSLNMSLVRPTALSTTQLSWLLAAQVQAVANYDLNLLPATQVPNISTAQIASIPNSGFFTAWSASARAALTTAQVQAIAPAALSISLLTPAQIAVLTAAQIRSVPAFEIPLLQAAQIPQLQISQVAAVTSLASWSPALRGALTVSQVQALNVALVRIEMLTLAQRGWLTVGQVRSLAYFDLAFLPAVQVSSITVGQIASIPTTGVLATWSPEARAALNAAQVQSIAPAALTLPHLTAQQIGYLLPVQIHQVPVYEFSFLGPPQVRQLTTAQIASINTRGLFSAWSPASRAALLFGQVRALDVANAGITLLSPAQVAWLSTAQVQAVPSYEWSSLQAWQIPLLPPSAFASISGAGTLALLPDDLQVMLTREQLLSLPANVWAGYSLATQAPSNYHPVSHMPIGPDGIQISAHMTEEANRFFALAPVQAATNVALASGDWTNPAIWSTGAVPAAGAKVHIGAGVTVRFNAYMNTAIDWLRIDGALQFAVDQNTQLKADTVLVTTSGKLHIGTAANPIQGHVTARVLIADGGPIDTVRDPYKLSRGVLSRGEVRMYGQVVTPYASLAVNPSQGDTQLQLAAVPTNWKVGDRLVVTGVVPTRADFGADEVTIQAINGSLVTVTPLQFSHVPPAGYSLSVQVANLNRNIIFQAEDPTVVQERPHMVFFHNPNVEIENIRVVGFGRTDKSIAVNDPVVVNGVLQPGTGTNPRARYAIHFHHTGVNPAQRQAVVKGSVVEGSPGWGYVNHSSNVNIENNVAFKVNGSSFVTEDGNEIGVMRNNLAISTTGVFDNIAGRSAIHDYGFRGNGFWFQGPGVAVTGNISAGSTDGGFVYFTTSARNKFDAVNLSDPELAGGHETMPIDTVPMKQFSGNTAYGGRAGLEVWHHMSRLNDGQSYVDDFTSWNNHMAGIEFHYSGQVTIRNSTLVGSLTNPTGTAVATNRFTDDITIEHLHAAGFQIGILAPVRGSTIVYGGYFVAVQGIYIEKGYDARRYVDVSGPVTFAPLSASQLAGRTQYSMYMSMNVDFAEQAVQNPESFFARDVIFYRVDGEPAYELFYFNQMRGVAPFTAAAAGSVPANYLGLKNWQLQQTFGKMFNGAMVANFDSFERPGFYGLLQNLV